MGTLLKSTSGEIIKPTKIDPKYIGKKTPYEQYYNYDL